MRSFDVVIVGSGPAGSSAAYFLRDSGLSVAVIERLGDCQFRRYHNICAAGISAKTSKILPIGDEFILNRFDKVTLRIPGGNDVDVKAQGYIIDRPKFFTHLLKSSNADVIKSSVTDIVEDDGYVLSLSNGEKIQCKHLVGADGAFSIVRKKMFGTRPKNSFPVTEFVVGGESPEGLEITIDERFRGGYSWRFPRGTNVCTGGEAGVYDEGEFVSKGTRFIPIGGVGPIVKGNAYLLGDAAAMANPVSFGGLSAAIKSARKATECILSGKPQEYQRWWDGSRMSDRRFMDFHEKVSEMDNAELEDMGRLFRHGNIYLDGALSCARHPSRVHLYFACLFAFTDGW